MMDRFSKLTKATLTTKAITALVSTIFINDRIPTSLILSHVLTDNGPKFTTRYFQVSCEELGVKPLTTAEYHTQANKKSND